MRKLAENNVDYQSRAKEFSIGDRVIPYGLFDSQSGRVTAVYPAIGMVDVEFAIGNKRIPVEVLTRYSESNPIPPFTDSSPISGKKASAHRVAMYWTEKNRKYRATKEEVESKTVHCPKCSITKMEKTVYSRDGGASEHLMGCPTCLFLIRFEDIVNHWKWAE